MCSKKLECSLGMIQAWRNDHSGVLTTGASSKTMHMVIQIRMWTLSNDIKKAAVGMRLARDSGKGKLFFPMPDKELDSLTPKAFGLLLAKAKAEENRCLG